MGDLNPFVYDDPLRPSALVDRESESTQLLELAEGGHNTRLQAPRRYGKTSLLVKVMDDAHQMGMTPIYVDFYRALVPVQIIGRIEAAYTGALRGPVGRTVQNLLRRWRGSIKATPGGVGVEAEYLSDADQERHLAELLDLPKKVFEKTGKRTLVVFDEFQDFLRAEGEIDGLIRSKIQFHRDEASYIFAGSEPGMLEELFGSTDRPLFNQARPIPLGPLGDDDLAEYIGAQFEHAQRDPGEGLDSLLDLVRGHPQRAMLLAHHLFEQTARGQTADEDTFVAALAAVERETAGQFEAIWKGLAKAPNQRRILVAIAQGGGDRLYSRSTLRSVGLSRGAVSDPLDVLIGSGDVQKAAGGYVIVDPLLERWLRAESAPIEFDWSDAV
jgi:hypothetical protein